MDYIEMFLKYKMKIQKLAEGTLKSYRYNLQLFFKWVKDTTGEEDFRPELMTKMLIEDYKQSLRKEKPRYISKQLIVIKMFSLWAYDQQLIDHDPAKTIILPVIVGTGMRWLNPNERKRLINYISRDDIGSRLRLIVVLGLSAGLRVEEVTNIQKEHLHLMATKGTLQALGKGEKWRTVPLNKNVVEAIREYWEDYPERMSGYLFTNLKKGTKLTTRAIQYMMEDLQEELRFDVPITYHRLRHTCFKKMADDQEPLDRIALIAGHIKKNGRPNLSTTVIYTQPNIEDLQKAVERQEWD